MSCPVILKMWENKSGAGADPHPFWTWWLLIYILSSATFLLNVRIILPGPFSYGYSFYVVCVCNHYCRTNHNCRSMMGLMSLISCLSDTFSSYCVYFSLIMILTVMVLVPGHLVRALFHFPLKIPLVVSVKYFPLIVSVEFFRWSYQQNFKSWSNRRIDSNQKIDSTIRIDSTPQIIVLLKKFIASN